MTDLEDIIHHSQKSDVTPENFSKYADIVYTLYSFMLSHYDINDFKKLFTKEYMRLGRTSEIKLKKSNLVEVYKILIEKDKITDDPFFWKCIQKKPVRNTSSVNPVTLMYSPYPNGQGFTCRFKCKYCQTHPDYPKSYGPEAPASARGIANGFDAISQMNANLRRLAQNGHEVDKLEMNYEGGTFSEIPEDYIEAFHRDSYYAANIFYDKEKREPLSLEEEMKINETARVHIIGMTIETRPDTIAQEQLKFFRKLGVTRVQIGVQHTDDTILKKSARGHDYTCAVEATHLLKSNGFKVVHHYMTALPYSTPKKDFEMLDTVYSSTRGRPHEIKLYPYSVVAYSEFEKEYTEGKFTLYSDENPEAFQEVMKHALKACPRDIRIDRAVRDIPTTYILGGCSTPNLRQLIVEDLEKNGEECNDIRSREISRRNEYTFEDAIYKTTESTPNDYIITLESPDGRALFGFLRLRLNSHHNSDTWLFPELIHTAIIEELHVYSTNGMLVPVGTKKQGASQHKGVGKTLVKHSEWVAWSYGYKQIAVISGEGVRTYYQKLGYDYGIGQGRFMIKKFWFPLDRQVIMYIIYQCVVIFLVFIILGLNHLII